MIAVCAVCWALLGWEENSPQRKPQAHICGPEMPVAEAMAAMNNAPWPNSPVFFNGKQYRYVTGPELRCREVTR